MFLRNHGVVCCGRSIEEAWLMTYHTVLACDTQLKMMPFGLDNLVLIGKHFLLSSSVFLHIKVFFGLRSYVRYTVAFFSVSYPQLESKKLITKKKE
jgi:hypothetical protein